ncbi:predicted protein, partial [Naegleria gruberi]
MEKEDVAEFYRKRQNQKEREKLINACRIGSKIAQSQNFGKRKREDYNYNHVFKNLEYYKNLFDIELSDFQTVKDLFVCLARYFNDKFTEKAIEIEIGKVWAKLLDPNIIDYCKNSISQQAVHELQVDVIQNIWYLFLNPINGKVIPNILEASSIDHLFLFFNDTNDICCSTLLQIARYHPELVDRRKIVAEATQLIERGNNEDTIDLYFD